MKIKLIDRASPLRPPPISDLELLCSYECGDGNDRSIYRSKSGLYFLRLNYDEPAPVSEAEAIANWVRETAPDCWQPILMKKAAPAETENR
jgi:hypothetical protein